MKCPQCLVEIYSRPRTEHLLTDSSGHHFIRYENCPSCNKGIITYVHSDQFGENQNSGAIVPMGTQSARLVVPLSAQRICPIQVPDDIKGDFIEACNVYPLSPKASAALSRRCLQHVLRTAAGVKQSDLYNEIQEVLNSRSLPTLLASSIDAVRNIGNFAAHPMKSTNTGEIIDVEPGEAEWLLDVLESLFDHYYVQPANLQMKRDALNAKLAAAGKPPIK